MTNVQQTLDWLRTKRASELKPLSDLVGVGFEWLRSIYYDRIKKPNAWDIEKLTNQMVKEKPKGRRSR